MAHNLHNPPPTVRFWICVAIFVLLAVGYILWALVRALSA